MATGVQTPTNNRFTVVRLLDAELAATGAPVEAAEATALSTTPTADQFFDLRSIKPAGGMLKNCGVRVYNTAGTNPVSVTYIRVWLYWADIGKAFPYGVGADADKGKLNDTTIALGETATDKVRHFEVIPDIGLADGIQVELGVTGGTGAEAFTVDLIIPAYAES